MKDEMNPENGAKQQSGKTLCIGGEYNGEYHLPPQIGYRELTIAVSDGKNDEYFLAQIHMEFPVVKSKFILQAAIADFIRKDHTKEAREEKAAYFKGRGEKITALAEKILERLMDDHSKYMERTNILNTVTVNELATTALSAARIIYGKEADHD